jgi:transposase
MGALNFAHPQLVHQQAVGTVKRPTFVAFIDHMLLHVATAKPTFIVLDNAKIHHGLDDEITTRWLTMHNATLVYLPPYSPELNMIE